VRAYWAKAWERSVPQRVLGLAALVLFLVAPWLFKCGDWRPQVGNTGASELVACVRDLPSEVEYERDDVNEHPTRVLAFAVLYRESLAELALVPLAALVLVVVPARRLGVRRATSLLGTALVAGFVARWSHSGGPFFEHLALWIILPLTVPLLTLVAGLLARRGRPKLVVATLILAGSLVLAFWPNPRQLGTEVDEVEWGARATLACFALALLMESLRPDAPAPADQPP
jgi:hypothetical protein